jgi:uncharacterized protein with von Willebrand factor type A (vWA) domain
VIERTHGAGPSVAARSLPRFVRGLRDAGVRVGTGPALVAAEALAQIDITLRGDVRDALRTTLIADAADLAVFDALFEMLYPVAPIASGTGQPTLPRFGAPTPAPGSRRLAAALAGDGRVRAVTRDDLREVDAAGTASAVEVLTHKDFEQMTAGELEQARRLLRAAWPLAALRRTRRWVRSSHGSRLDLRRMLRDEARGNAEPTPRRLARSLRPRDWVLLIDISGSMATYSRMFLQYAHALARRANRVETFVFATRLTRVSRALQSVDADRALLDVSGVVADWDSGTRIGDCLAEFNLRWSRRVLSRGAWVLLLTDGLERGSAGQLELETRRLARSCPELIWLNPLRRSPTYQPLAAGAAVLARYATRQRTAHNVASLLELSRLIETERDSRPQRSP